MAAPRYSLRFISGKYRGGSFPAVEGRALVLGRSGEVDLVLVDDNVSRRHARLSLDGGELLLEDLGSTNGTFVNGERVERAILKEGDRILIGTSILRVVPAEAAVAMPPEPVRGPPGPNGTRPATSSIRRLAGAIEEIPLPDLMQLLSTSRKSGLLQLQNGRSIGRIFFRQGRIYYASLDDAFDLPPRKAFFRLLGWNRGSFEMESAPEQAVLEEIDETTEFLLMEGMRLLDETARLSVELPADTGLRLAEPLEAPLRELSAAELDTLQLALNLGRVGAVLDRDAGSDADAWARLATLVHRGYLVAEPAATTALDLTAG